MRSLLPLLLLPALALAAAPAVPTSPAVAPLIDRLGDDDAEVRASAEKKLAEFGDDAVPALRAASKKHADIDVRLRAMVVARNIRAKTWGLVKALGPGAALQGPHGGGYWLNRVRLSRDGKYAVAAGGALILYDVATGKEVDRVLEVGGARPALDLSSDGKLALTGHGNDAKFHLVEIPSLKVKQTFEGHKIGLWCVALSPDATTAVSVGRDQTVRLWDVKTGKESGQQIGLSGQPLRAVFSPDGKRLLVGLSGKEGDETLRLFDVESRKQLRGFKGHKTSVSGVQFLPGGKTAAACDGAGQVIVWDLGSGKRLAEMDHGATVNDLAVSGDGRRALTAGVGDRLVKVWDLEAGKLIETFDGHAGAVLGVGFSADGRRAVSCDWSCCVRVWKLGR